MAVDRLDELEQRWRDSGDPADGLAFAQARLRRGLKLADLPHDEGALVLSEQVRAGALSPEQLELAAYSGLPAARLALGEEAPEAIADPDRIGEWAEALAPWGTDVLLQAALAALQVAAARLERRVDDEDELLPGMVEALEAYVGSPSPARARAFQEAAGLVTDLLDEREGEEDALRAVDLIGEAVAAAQRGEAPSSLAFGVSDALQAASRSMDPRRLFTAVRRTILASALQPRRRRPKGAGEGRPYAPRERYQVGERIEHPKFGSGTVERVAGKQIEVAFADATRKLAHGMG